MKAPHILLAGRNPRQIKANLVRLLDDRALQSIENEIVLNVRQLFALGVSHYAFASKVQPREWRQRVSRTYYAAYNVSRAVRFFHSGEYSVESKDHKRFDELPDSFPNKSTYSNQFDVLRDDRNLCDYDHTAVEADLVLAPAVSLELVSEFIASARAFFLNAGLSIEEE